MGGFGREAGRERTVDDVAKNRVGRERPIWWEISEGVEIGLAGETTTPSERRER